MSIGSVLRKVRQLPLRIWPAAARAVVELARARMQLSDDHSSRLSKAASGDASPPLSPGQRELIERVGFTIPRVAARMPFRADCMVQSLAAKHWLERHDIPTRLRIGVRSGGATPLDAHAWLEVGDEVVVGGDVSGFAPMTG
jgi:hypothetical protein